MNREDSITGLAERQNEDVIGFSVSNTNKDVYI